MIDPGIYSVGGKFGSGKTLLMARRITKLVEDPKNVIFTNIQMKFEKPNLYIYNEVFTTKNKDGEEETHYGLVDILQLIGKIDDFQREKNVNRNDRLRFFIFDDEAGITFNQHNRKKFPLEMYDYLLQVRKINVYMFLAAQKYKNISKQIREHIDSVFYRQPFLGIKRFKNFGTIRQKMVDDEGQIEMEKYIAKDDQGDWITKERPLDRHVEYTFKKSRRKVYDDLYLNKKFSELGHKISYKNLKTYVKNKIETIDQVQPKKQILGFLKPKSKQKLKIEDIKKKDALTFIRREINQGKK